MRTDSGQDEEKASMYSPSWNNKKLDKKYMK